MTNIEHKNVCTLSYRKNTLPLWLRYKCNISNTTTPPAFQNIVRSSYINNDFWLIHSITYVYNNIGYKILTYGGNKLDIITCDELVRFVLYRHNKRNPRTRPSGWAHISWLAGWKAHSAGVGYVRTLLNVPPLQQLAHNYPKHLAHERLRHSVLLLTQLPQH